MSSVLALTSGMACSLLCCVDLQAQQQASGPVQVFILSGQSNMVGAGKVDGGSSRWGSQFLDPIVSVYEGSYDASKNYDELEPLTTLKLDAFGGVRPTPYPAGGVHVTRGFIQVRETGIYEFRPGYGGSMNNVMLVNGQEVHRTLREDKAA